ncbi:MAG TPA: hypothetical protein VL175_15150 [Pirellulales bacterium]|nr:hypothetical protein [Pirellulales bacterium]
MLQTVADKVQAAADKLGLTSEQKTTIAEIKARHADQWTALRAERRSLRQKELESINSILTPEQRDQVKALADDKVEHVEQAIASGLQKSVALRASLAERIEAAADKLGLTSDQRKQIVKSLATTAQQHAESREKCRDAIESEFKDIAAVLTPDQREKARNAIEVSLLRAAAASSIADRLEAIADKLGLSADQRRQIARTHARFASQYGTLNAERRELLENEMKEVAATLTPQQREKVKDFCEDRVVVIEVRTAARDTAESEPANLRETISDRLEAVADKLGLTADQRTKIKNVRSAMSEKFKEQRDRRKALRTEELKAIGEILTPEQREQVKNFVEDDS